MARQIVGHAAGVAVVELEAQGPVLRPGLQGMSLKGIDLACQSDPLATAIGVTRGEEGQVAAVGRRRHRHHRRRAGEQGQQRQGATAEEGIALIVHAGFRFDKTHFNLST
jgi:hypothetical protein